MIITSILRLIIGDRKVSQIKACITTLRRRFIFICNEVFGYEFINIGAGRDAECFRWWAGDYQNGFVINESTKLPFKSNSIKHAYSSMFFEHIDDVTAENLLREVYRVLRPGAILRVVVPDFMLYLEQYHKKNIDFFYDPNDQNFATWGRLCVPLDLEHLLVGMISSIHNLPHKIVSYQYQEDFSKNPPHVFYPFQLRYEGYYCGPAPELTSLEIKQKISELSPKAFINWVFERTQDSYFQDRSFNAWHKNQWDYEKLAKISKSIGFSLVKESSFGDTPIPLSNNIERQGHKKIGLYFNVIK
jgi:SAM-dependent methyltransferase